MLYTRTMAWTNCTKVKSLPLCGLEKVVKVSQSATFSFTRSDRSHITMVCEFKAGQGDRLSEGSRGLNLWLSNGNCVAAGIGE